MKIGEKGWRDVSRLLQVSDKDAFMALNVFENETKDEDGNPTMDIFKEPKKITDICEKYANFSHAKNVTVIIAS